MAIKPTNKTKAKKMDNQDKNSKTSAYSISVASIRILISGSTSERLVKSRNAGDPDRTLYSQKALIVGGPIQHNIEVSTFEKADIYDEGSYLLSNTIFKPDQYGGLSFDKYAPNKFIFSGPLSTEQKKLFESLSTDIKDYA